MHVPASSRLSTFAIDAPSRRVHRHEHVLRAIRGDDLCTFDVCSSNTTITPTFVLTATIELYAGGRIYVYINKHCNFRNDISRSSVVLEKISFSSLFRHRWKWRMKPARCVVREKLLAFTLRERLLQIVKKCTLSTLRKHDDDHRSMVFYASQK